MALISFGYTMHHMIKYESQVYGLLDNESGLPKLTLSQRFTVFKFLSVYIVTKKIQVAPKLLEI